MRPVELAERPVAPAERPVRPAAVSPATRRAVTAAGVIAAALAGTAAALWWLLPDDASVGNWSLAWTGFDLGVAALALVTAVLLRRGDPRAGLAAAAGAALLVADAWFDVTTATTTAGTWLAVGEAVLVELPLAVLALRLAARLLCPPLSPPAPLDDPESGSADDVRGRFRSPIRDHGPA